MRQLKNLSENIAKISLLIVLVACGLPTNVFAKFGRHSRIEIGYSYVMATGTFKGTSGVYDFSNPYNPNYLRDTSVKMNVSAKFGLGYTMGINFPLARLGKRSTLALYWGLIYNEYLWGDLNPVFNVDGSVNSNTNPFGNSLTGFTVKIGMPIGLDVKIGTDALCQRNPHIGCTFGAGIVPQYNLTAMSYTGSNADDFNISAGLNYGVNPYLKGEFSFFAGICMKLKLIYMFGNVPLIDHTKNIISTDGPFTLSENSSFTMSFTVLPFSFLWKKRHWYNDYETEIPYKN